jgi:hypothetical protein
MADEKKISRRSFLKGAAAAGAVAATGIPTKAGPDRFTTMLTDLKKDFKTLEKLSVQKDAIRMSPAGIKDLLQKGEITKSFANKVLALAGRGEEKAQARKKLAFELEEKRKSLTPAYNEKLDKTRDYAQKNNKQVLILGSGDTRNLKPGERASYERQSKTYLSNTPGRGNIPIVTTPEFRAAKKDYEKKTGQKLSNNAFSVIYKNTKNQKPKPKSAVKGGRGGAGAGRSEEGVHTVFEGPKLVKVEKDFRKGGMVLSTTNNLKKR